MGGRLAHFSDHWKMLGDESAVRIVSKGVLLQFDEHPPLTTSPRSFPSRGSQNLLEVALQLLQKGAVERVVDTASPGFYSRLFVVPKASGGLRPVIDLSSLNQHVVCPHFKMETGSSIRASLQHHEWTASVDLKDAYFHIPLHRSARPYCRFMVGSQVFQFCTLPFGLCTAPREFTKLSLSILKFLRARGIKVHAYLDDWIVRGSSPDAVRRQITFTVKLLTRLGWIINWEKSDLTPRRHFAFLGMRFDLDNFLVAPEEKHRAKLLLIINRLHLPQPVSARFLHSLLGVLQFLSTLVHRGKLHLRAVQAWMRTRWSQAKGSWEDHISQDQELLSLLRWWTRPHLLEGVPLRPPHPTQEVCSDASKEGWGATLGEMRTCGTWNNSYRTWHINALELEAIRLTLLQFSKHLANTTVRLYCDNTTAVSYLRNEGGTYSPHLNLITEAILSWCDQFHTTVIPVHLPGSRNVVADSLSRQGKILQGEWTLNRQVLCQVFDLWGTPSTDMFATRKNKQAADFVSPVPDAQALAIDALSINWSNRGLVYAFPPTVLIPRVLEIIRSSSGVAVILIAPASTARPYHPDLLEMSRAPHQPLPQSRTLLSQRVPGLKNRVYHLAPQTLALAAWLV